MSVSSTATKVEYPGDGATTSLPVPFRFLDASHLVVTVIDADGAETAKTLTTHYTVTQTATGGTVAMLAATPAGSTTRIQRVTPLTQPDSLRVGGAFDPRTVENMADRSLMQLQEADAVLDRAALVPDGVAVALPDPEAGTLLGWNADRSALVNYGAEDFLPGATAGVAHQYNVLAGATTLDVSDIVTPFGIGQLFYNGVFQNPSCYSRSGDTLTFTEALPAAGVVTIIAVFRSADQVTDSAQLFDTAAATGATTRSVRDKLGDIVSVKDFGAKGDGVTDDTARLQAALDSNRMVLLPPGKYRTTSALVVDPIRNRNTGFIAAGEPSRYPSTAQTGGPAWDGTKEAVIWYDGPADANACVIRASAEVVGTEPAATFDNTVWGLHLENVLLDGNGKAGFGLYCARVQALNLVNVKATGATVAGISINGTYSGSCRRVHCFLNRNRGFELGGADDRWGWTAQDKVNALRLYDIHCESNGGDQAFREADAVLRESGCGFYFGPHRGVTVYGLISENNYGANIVFKPTSSGNLLSGVYTELGNKYAPGGAGTDAVTLGHATRQNGLVFVGSAAALNNVVEHYAASAEYVWITGTEPTASRRESAFELRNVSLAAGLVAAWGNYRLVNCALEVESITGTTPAGAISARGGIQFGSGKVPLTVYEEGTWTPALAGITTAGTGWAYSVAAGSYTRIGRTVFYTARITLSAVSADATGQIAITGLPYPVKSGNNYYAAANVSNVLALTTAVVSLTARADQGFSRVSLYKRTAAAASEGSLVLADLSATTTLHVSGHFDV